MTPHAAQIKVFPLKCTCALNIFDLHRILEGIDPYCGATEVRVGRDHFFNRVVSSYFLAFHLVNCYTSKLVWNVSGSGMMSFPDKVHVPSGVTVTVLFLCWPDK